MASESHLPLFDVAASEESVGRWDAAIRTYEQAFQQSVGAGDVPLLLETLTRLGHAYRGGDRREEAEEAFGLVLAIARGHADPRMEGRALNGLAGLRHMEGHLDEAEALFMAALELGRASGYERLVGESEANLGVLANIRGDLETARTRYLSGLEHLRRAGGARQCAYALNNLGMVHISLGEIEAADEYFQAALQICDQTGDIFTAGAVHINRAELFLARDDSARARESCDNGFEIFSRLGDEIRLAEALKFYGIIYRQTGKLHLAAVHLQQAIEIGARKDAFLEGQAQRELAAVMRAQGRNREALEALNRAHFLFSSMRAELEHSNVAERIAQIENEFLSLVRMWGESIEAKDRYTGGHCERVAEYACRLAAELGLPEREIVWFRMGAFLHDVGKTEVPAEILNKPGRLTDEERAIMERHTVIGDEMLSTVEFPWDVRPMVRSHHERWDGAGYPDRLRGEKIPYYARILRVADVFDALTSTRSYRRPLTPDEAFLLMDTDEGSFDPGVFEAFRRLLPEMARTAEAAARKARAEAGRPEPARASR